MKLLTLSVRLHEVVQVQAEEPSDPEEPVKC